MINHDYRCIYIHIPKTAGNSINRVFGVQWRDHKDLASYAAEQPGEVIEQYYKFAIVRNPWARMLSDYNYQKKKSRADKLFLHDSDGEQRLFRAWIEAVLADPFRYAATTWGGDVSSNIHRWSPQVDWMSLHGSLAVDKVVHLENLSQGLAKYLLAPGNQHDPCAPSQQPLPLALFLVLRQRDPRFDRPVLRKETSRHLATLSTRALCANSGSAWVSSPAVHPLPQRAPPGTAYRFRPSGD